jgi:hypothetical protein
MGSNRALVCLQSRRVNKKQEENHVHTKTQPRRRLVMLWTTFLSVNVAIFSGCGESSSSSSTDAKSLTPETKEAIDQKKIVFPRRPENMPGDKGKGAPKTKPSPR